MGNENFQKIRLDESRFIVYLMKYQILKYCTKYHIIANVVKITIGSFVQISDENSPKLKRGEMYLQRKSYMVNNTRVIFSFPVKDLHMSYFQVIGLQGIYIPILLLSMHNFSTCKRFKTYDTYWDSILLFFIVLKVSSITCPGKLSETQNLFQLIQFSQIQTFSIYYQLRYKKAEIQWNIRVSAHESLCIENKKFKFTWKVII